MIEVAGDDALRPRRAARRRQRQPAGIRAIARAVQDLDRRPGELRPDDVGDAVAVEIADRDPARVAGEREIDRRSEAAVPGAEEQRDGVAVGVGDGDVERAVAVQVADREVERSAAHRHDDRILQLLAVIAFFNPRVATEADRAEGSYCRARCPASHRP